MSQKAAVFLGQLWVRAVFFRDEFLHKIRLAWDLATGTSSDQVGSTAVWHGSAMGKAGTAPVMSPI